MKLTWRLCCLLWCVSATASIHAETPDDPRQFMQTAADSMSLNAPTMKPWHLRARYQQSGAGGVMKQEGIFEVWWAAPDEYKTSYTSPAFTQTVYRVGKNTFITGQPGWPPLLQLAIDHLLLHPLPVPEFLAKTDFAPKDLTLSSGTFHCYAAQLTKPSPAGSTAYCFDPSAATLRLIMHAPDKLTDFNSLVRVHDHYLAKQIREHGIEGRGIHIDVEQIEATLGADTSALVPPQDATPMPTLALVAKQQVAPKLIHSVEPEFPKGTSLSDKLDTTLIKIVVSTTGAIEDAYAVGGAPLLQRVELEAIKHYGFKPAKLLGIPIESEVTVTVNQ